jgi:hypothetical protein
MVHTGSPKWRGIVGPLGSANPRAKCPLSPRNKITGAEQLMRDDKRADGIVAGAAPGIADDVSIPFLETSELGGIEARIHAGEDGKAASRWQGETAFVAELRCIGFIRRKHFIENVGHGKSP